MNRAERRRSERETAARLNASAELGYACAWRECDRTYKGKIPEGWRNLVVIKKDLLNWDGFGADRDAVLCPNHVKELDGLLKSLREAIPVVPVPHTDGSITYLAGELGERG
jgi:hypothetical protein